MIVKITDSRRRYFDIFTIYRYNSRRYIIQTLAFLSLSLGIHVGKQHPKQSKIQAMGSGRG